LVAALASTLLPGPWGTIIETIPGGGLARDAHKLLAPWVLLVAASAGSGAALLARLVRERSARIVVVGALAVLPVACMPDLLWGLGERWQAVDYPDDWSVVRTTLQQDARPGDVASFPWTAFRRFAWNGDRTMLDPAPRWLPRTTVVADNLVVATPAGVVDVSGDDPRARAIDVALTSGQPVGDTLASLGIGWAVVALGTPGPVPELSGWELVVDGDDLDLYAAPAAVEPARSPAYLSIVAAADAATVLVLLGGVAGLAIRRVRVHPGSRLVP
jgi:hypothetical protein